MIGVYEEFESAMDYVAAKVLEQVTGEVVCGGPCQKVEVDKVDLGLC